jgi:hypothetical protein
LMMYFTKAFIETIVFFGVFIIFMGIGV